MYNRCACSLVTSELNFLHFRENLFLGFQNRLRSVRLSFFPQRVCVCSTSRILFFWVFNLSFLGNGRSRRREDSFVQVGATVWKSGAGSQVPIVEDQLREDRFRLSLAGRQRTLQAATPGSQKVKP